MIHTQWWQMANGYDGNHKALRLKSDFPICHPILGVLSSHGNFLDWHRNAWGFPSMNLVLEKPHPTIQKHPRKATSTEIYRDFGDWCSSCWTMKTSQLESFVFFFFGLQKKKAGLILKAPKKWRGPITPGCGLQHDLELDWCSWRTMLSWAFLREWLQECSQGNIYPSIHPSIYSYTRFYHIIFYHVSCIHVLDIKYYMLCIYIYTIYIYISCYILHIAYIISYYIKLYKHIIYYHIIYHVVYYDIFCYMYSII